MFWKKKKPIKKRNWVNDIELLEYLDHQSRLLNGQLRGVINSKATESNLEFIQLVLHTVAERVYEMGKNNGYIEKSQEKIGK